MELSQNVARNYRRATQQARDAHYNEITAINTEIPNAGNGGWVRTYMEGTDETRATHAARTKAADDTYAAAKKEAAQAAVPEGLDEASAKMVTYIVTSGVLDDYPDHANRVLEWLPATYSELLTKGHDAGWCNTFDQLLNRAVSNGALVDNRTATERLNEVKRSFGMGGSSARSFDAAVRAAVEEQVAAKLAEAKAQEPVDGNTADVATEGADYSA